MEDTQLGLRESIGLLPAERFRLAEVSKSHPIPMRGDVFLFDSKRIHFLTGSQLRIDHDVCKLVVRPRESRLNRSVFKDERRRFVASLDLTADDGQQIVIKAFRLTDLFAKLRWRRYGYREFCNHREAVGRGIPTAELHAYFQVKNRFGITENCGVLIEYLSKHVTLREGLQHDAIDRWQSLADVAGLMHLCKTRGVNHVDFSVDNIMIGGEGPKLIDWQYATFFESERDSQTVMQTAYFLQTSPFGAGSRERSFFTSEVYSRVRPQVSRERFESLVDSLSNCPRVSVRKRANLNIKVLKALEQE